MRSQIRIGPAAFDPITGEVLRQGMVIRLEPQPAAILALLARCPGALVTHDELRRAVWGDAVHVNFQQNLHYAVRQIRRALGDTDRSAPVIEGVPRRGYRLRAAVAALDAPATRGEATERWRRRWPLWTGVVAAALVAVAVIERRPNDHHRMAVAALQAVHDLVY